MNILLELLPYLFGDVLGDFSIYSPKHFGSRYSLLHMRLRFLKNPPHHSPICFHSSLLFSVNPQVSFVFNSNSFHNVIHFHFNSAGGLFGDFSVTSILVFQFIPGNVSVPTHFAVGLFVPYSSTTSTALLTIYLAVRSWTTIPFWKCSFARTFCCAMIQILFSGSSALASSIYLSSGYNFGSILVPIQSSVEYSPPMFTLHMFLGHWTALATYFNMDAFPFASFPNGGKVYHC